MTPAAEFLLLLRAAVAGRSVPTSDYQLGPWSVRLHHHSERLANRFLPALSHRLQLAEPGRVIHFSIHLMDGNHDPDFPKPPWKQESTIINGVVPGYSDASSCVVFDAWSRLLSAIDWVEGAGYFFAPDASLIPAWEDAAPLRVLLNLWAGHHGGHLMHGAALGSASGALLLTGPGGSGKSTSALQWLSQGGGYLSDDYCCVTMDPAPRVHSLYCSAKVVPEDTQKYLGKGIRFTSVENARGEKPAVILNPEFASQFIASSALKAILLPVITGKSGPPTITPCARGLAWRALALPTFSQLPGGGRKSMEFLSSFINLLPCYQLELGGPPESVPLMLREFLANFS